MKRALLVACILWSATTAFAQHTVSGIITDKKDNTKLISDVCIYIPEFNRLDFSKEGGTYILRNIGVGKVTIQFTRTGYRPLVKIIDTKDSATVVNVELEPSAEELREVSVTADRIRSAVDLPFATTIVAGDELNRTGVLHPMAALSYNPGIDRITQGNGIQRPVIRGLSGSNVLSYQYGVRLENQAWDDLQDLEVNDAGTDYVEVVKGPASILYGSNAMGGVLIWNDEKPPVAGHINGRADVTYHTNTAGFESGLHVNGASKNGLIYALNFGSRIHSSYVQGDSGAVDKNQVDKDFAANSKFNNMDIKAMAGLSRKWGISKVTFSLLKQQLGVIENENAVSRPQDGSFSKEQREYELEAPYLDVASTIISWQNSIILGSGSLQANFSLQNGKRTEYEPDPTLGKEDRIEMELETSTYDVHYTTDPSKKLGITTGIQGMFQENRNEGQTAIVPNASTRDAGAYALARYELKEFSFLGGARFDQRSIALTSYTAKETDSVLFSPDNLTFNAPSYALGTVWKATNDFSIRVNGAGGFTPPNAYQLAANGRKEGGYRYERGDSSLKATTNLQVDLGFNYDRPSFGFSASVYHNSVQDFIYLVNSGTSTTVDSAALQVYDYRQGDAVLKGCEFGLDLHPRAIPWIDLAVNYGFVRGALTQSGQDLPYQPADKLTASISLQKEKMQSLYNPFIRVVLSNYATQNRVSEFELTSPGYTLLDLHLGGSIKIGGQLIDLTLSGTNLLNQSYFNHLSLVKDINVHDMGRNICIRLKVPFGIINPDKPARNANAAPQDIEVK